MAENIAPICVSENQNIFSGGAGQVGQIKAWGRFARQAKSVGCRSTPPSTEGYTAAESSLELIAPNACTALALSMMALS
jgi:hypothetical protein